MTTCPATCSFVTVLSVRLFVASASCCDSQPCHGLLPCEAKAGPRCCDVAWNLSDQTTRKISSFHPWFPRLGSLQYLQSIVPHDSWYLMVPKISWFPRESATVSRIQAPGKDWKLPRFGGRMGGLQNAGLLGMDMDGSSYSASVFGYFNMFQHVSTPKNEGKNEGKLMETR